MTERKLDEAIDRAVRTMMDVDPPVGFDARVRSRIDSPARPARGWLPAAALAGAAAAVLLTVLLVREQGPEPGAMTGAPVNRPAAERVSPVHPGPTTAASREPSALPREAGRVPQPRRAGRVTGRSGVLSSEEGTIAIVPPIHALEPLGIAPLEAPSIAPAAIAIPPLDPIDSLTIEPLSPRAERD
jgi:hypothetical protein